MYEYEIMNMTTNEHDFIHGYNQADAWRRASWIKDKAAWKIIHTGYID